MVSIPFIWTWFLQIALAGEVALHTSFGITLYQDTGSITLHCFLAAIIFTLVVLLCYAIPWWYITSEGELPNWIAYYRKQCHLVDLAQKTLLPIGKWCSKSLVEEEVATKLQIEWDQSIRVRKSLLLPWITSIPILLQQSFTSNRLCQHTEKGVLHVFIMILKALWHRWAGLVHKISRSPHPRMATLVVDGHYLVRS